MNAPIISTNAKKDPDVGEEIGTILKGITTYKQRVLVGWTHQNDTPQGLSSGKIWGWVSEGGHFQVFDETFNRSDKAGDVRFCGVANFTMVRMFHPYWAHFGASPRDMNSEDKNWCRYKYRQFIRQWRIRNDLPVDDDDSGNPVQSGNCGRGRLSKRPTRRRGGRQDRRRPQRRRAESEAVINNEERLRGESMDEPMPVSDNNSDNEVTRVPRPKSPRIHVSELEDHIGVFLGRCQAKQEDSTTGALIDAIVDRRPSIDPVINLRARSIFTPPLNQEQIDSSLVNDNDNGIVIISEPQSRATTGGHTLSITYPEVAQGCVNQSRPAGKFIIDSQATDTMETTIMEDPSRCESPVSNTLRSPRAMNSTEAVLEHAPLPQLGTTEQDHRNGKYEWKMGIWNQSEVIVLDEE